MNAAAERDNTIDRRLTGTEGNGMDCAVCPLKGFTILEFIEVIK